MRAARVHRPATEFDLLIRALSSGSLVHEQCRAGAERRLVIELPGARLHVSFLAPQRRRTLPRFVAPAGPDAEHSTACPPMSETTTLSMRTRRPA